VYLLKIQIYCYKVNYTTDRATYLIKHCPVDIFSNKEPEILLSFFMSHRSL
jgi:hypothetical protein